MGQYEKCCEILEVSPQASEEEIKKAYHDLLMVWHPDRFGCNERLRKKAEEKTKKINNAIQILKTQNFIPPIEFSQRATWSQPSHSPKPSHHYKKKNSKTRFNIHMVHIPGGFFRMGDITGAGKPDERPAHIVKLNGFQMSVYLVTQTLFQTVMEKNPSYFNKGDDYPVESVSWLDAVQFCNKLSGQTGREKCYNESDWTSDFSRNGYRLPTEAEWEYACRAGTETNYYTGNSESDLSRTGWYVSNSSFQTHPIGLKIPNAWGLFDMHGNVWEWCNDWSGLYISDTQTNPTGPTVGVSRIRRGGGCCDGAGMCRSANRNQDIPSYTGSGVGFRVCLKI
jgi:formylglycine-generating enzyme required for sulfatase activity